MYGVWCMVIPSGPWLLGLISSNLGTNQLDAISFME